MHEKQSKRRELLGRQMNLCVSAKECAVVVQPEIAEGEFRFGRIGSRF